MFRYTGIVILDLTEGCNIGCEYCLMLNKDRHKGEVIDFELFKRIINKLAYQRILQGVAEQNLTLVFHGGEPFSVGKENFYKFAEYAYTTLKNLGIAFRLGTQTNGTFIDDEYLKILRKFGFSIGLSLDDLGEGNDLRMKNSEEFFLTKIELLKKNHMRLGVISVITTQNVKTLPTFIDKIRDTGGVINLLPFENPDGNSPEKFPFAPPIEDTFAVYQKLIDDFIEGHGVDLKFISGTLTMAVADMLTTHDRVFQSGCGGKICGTAIGMISVRPDGWFGNCDRFPDETEFNNLLRVEDYDFLSIIQLQRAIYLATIKHNLIAQRGCDLCEADYICDHGCMTFDYPRTGEFSIKKSTCGLYLRLYAAIRENIIPILLSFVKQGGILQLGERIYEVNPEIQGILEDNHGILVSMLDDYTLQITKKETSYV